MSLRPLYLPREFGQVFVTVAYSHPKANKAQAAAEIAEVVRSLQTISPDAPNLVLGDFNSCNLQTVLPKFKQYITCNTRQQGQPDRCYGNIKDAYKSVPLPNIGNSDHETVHLIPAYRPKIETEPVVSKSVKKWSKEAIETLQGCYECTDWDIFFDSSQDINETVDVISDYIVFCENMLIPQKTVKIYPNNKPWISKSLKATINQKKKAFQGGDKVERKAVQKKLRGEIRSAKLAYKEKVESKFQSGNMRDAWQGLKTLSGQNKPNSNHCSLTETEKVKFANDLNDFYCRFERNDLNEDLSNMVTNLQKKAREEVTSDGLDVPGSSVERLFKRLHLHKAVGPDCISGRLLRSCASQLSNVFSRLFSWSLKNVLFRLYGKIQLSVLSPNQENHLSSMTTGRSL